MRNTRVCAHIATSVNTNAVVRICAIASSLIAHVCVCAYVCVMVFSFARRSASHNNIISIIIITRGR